MPLLQRESNCEVFVIVISSTIVNRGEWLRNPTNFFVVCFCPFGLDHAQNTIVVYSVLRN